MYRRTEDELVEALSKQEDTILAELYYKYAKELREHFLIEFPVFQLDAFQLDDTITDALINLCNNPKKFDPEKSSLKTFLFRDVRFDIINALEKRKNKSNSVNNNLVELETASRNIDTITDDEEFEIDYGKLSESLSSYFETVFSNDLDRKLAWMIKVEKVRETKSYSNLLGLVDLSVSEQEEIVKRHKDRIIVRLKRYGYDDFVKELRRNT